jgi:tetratricopeptide (TPR) repeat protein
VTAPSRRTLFALAAGSLAVVVLGGGAWFWHAAEQRRVMAAYAVVMVRVAVAQSPQATAEARAAAARDLEAILARYPSASAAPQAAYELANLRYDAGQYVAARAAYEVALAQGATGTLRTLAQAGLGYAWEAERDWAKAIDAYRAALAPLGPKDFDYEPLLLDLARAQELAGRKTEAVETYRRILKEVPQARRAEEIRARLMNLGG